MQPDKNKPRKSLGDILSRTSEALLPDISSTLGSIWSSIDPFAERVGTDTKANPTTEDIR